ncbi:HAD family phosphatase [Candidatus Bathyarchaeota archaeon]|nr:HAD family phosphatase [Candidatus Bathyarchaeota archaeon]
MIKAVIFDFDGTIVDSYEAHLESFRRALRKYSLKVDDEEIYRRFGKPAKVILAEILPESVHHLIDDIVMEKRREFIETSSGIRLFKGVEETLRYLRSKGVCLGLATSADRPSVMRVLGRFSIQHYFDTVVSSEDVVEAKPNPRIFILTVERLGVEPDDCIIVGDSIFDVIAAVEAGMRIVVVANNPYQVEGAREMGVEVLDSMDELKNII